jgi:hypothetical protein
MMDFSPLPWGEGGESSEPGEGFLPTEPRNFGFWVHAAVLRVILQERVSANRHRVNPRGVKR